MYEITDAIDFLTDCVTLERIRLQRGLNMPMQLKGLRAKASGFRSALDDVGQSYDEGTDAARSHASDVRSLAAEFKDMKSDLDFAIGEVGNSSAVTGNGQTEPVITAAEIGPITVESAQPLGLIDLVMPNDPPAAIGPALPNPIMNHAPISRAVPSRRDL
jgi:hypothetical protein